ncbi:MAG: DNA-binding protein [Erysipelotrichaceae bacterium]|jgi:uncharacterized protein|nr:DNA-binding protein [Erysipelotrichaceae bacterium]MCB9500042.1 DNA-binding protein [Erysipelotrichaceae bacterium]
MMMNELEEFNYINALFEIYKSLLTDKQSLIMEKYYIFNLSFSEIAQEMKISRSGVCDALEHGKEKLRNYENNLHIYKKHVQITDILNNSTIDDNIKKKIKEVL